MSVLAITSRNIYVHIRIYSLYKAGGCPCPCPCCVYSASLWFLSQVCLPKDMPFLLCLVWVSLLGSPTFWNSILFFTQALWFHAQLSQWLSLSLVQLVKPQLRWLLMCRSCAAAAQDMMHYDKVLPWWASFFPHPESHLLLKLPVCSCVYLFFLPEWILPTAIETSLSVAQ